MGDLYLVRHGESADNEKKVFAGPTNAPLSELGRGQARALRERLWNIVEFQSVVTSDQERAIQTAEIVSGISRRVCRVESGFRERSNGEWEGRDKEAAKRDRPDEFQRWRDGLYRPPGGENFEDVLARMLKPFGRWREAAQASDRPVLIVASGNPLRAMLAYCLEIPFHRWQYLRFDYCGLTILRPKGAATELIVLNNTTHLASFSLGAIV